MTKFLEIEGSLLTLQTALEGTRYKRSVVAFTLANISGFVCRKQHLIILILKKKKKKKINNIGKKKGFVFFNWVILMM